MMKPKYTIFDLAAWTMNGLITGLMIWLVHASYQTANSLGYTPQSRAHMDRLVAQYQEPDYENIPRLSISDLEY